MTCQYHKAEGEEIPNRILQLEKSMSLRDSHSSKQDSEPNFAFDQLPRPHVPAVRLSRGTVTPGQQPEIPITRLPSKKGLSRRDREHRPQTGVVRFRDRQYQINDQQLINAVLFQ